MSKKKNGKTSATLPGLPQGAPEGSFPLTPEEASEIRAINATQRLLQSEAEKTQLQQNNLFLRIQLRTGQNMDGWGVDIQRGIAVPPGSMQKQADAPQVPNAAANKEELADQAKPGN